MVPLSATRFSVVLPRHSLAWALKASAQAADVRVERIQIESCRITDLLKFQHLKNLLLSVNRA